MNVRKKPFVEVSRNFALPLRGSLMHLILRLLQRIRPLTPTTVSRTELRRDMTDVLSRVEQGPVGVTLGHRLDQLIFGVDPSRTTFTATELDELTQLIYALIAEWHVVVGEKRSLESSHS